MSKAIQGVAMLGGAVAMGAAAFFDPALIASPFYDKIMLGLVMEGISMEAGAIADALSSNRGTSITTRQPAAARQIIYGTQRVGGVTVYESTTGGSKNQYNFIIAIAGHVCSGILGLYLDGRKVYFNNDPSHGTTTGPDGVTVFGGNADSTTRVGSGGQNYNFGGAVYCEAYYGNQTSAPNTTPGGGFSTGMQANDPTWTPVNGRTPYLGGCTYVYLKLEYNTTLFPSLPEIKFTVKGKPVYDPRSSTTAYSENWALIANDILTDPVYGMGDPRVNQAQLIAAANVCDEQVAVKAISASESRYTCHMHYDTSTSPSDALSRMMNVAAGRISDIGGEYYLWPAYWQGPSFAFNESALTGAFKWAPTRGYRDIFNRVTGTFTAPNYLYSVAGDLYDSNGWYEGTIQNNFPYGFQPTNFPQYAADPAHGYAADEYLIADSGSRGPWSASPAYMLGDVVTYDGAIWKSLSDANANNTPVAGSDYWEAFSNALPKEISLVDCLSITQAQRVAKIMLMRNRQQGTGSTEMTLAAAQMQPTDVFQMTFGTFGWSDKVLEVVGTTPFRLAQDSNGVVSVRFGIEFQETDPSVYEWNEQLEEQTVYAVQAGGQGYAYTPAPPTGLTITSGLATAQQQPDGTVIPRLQLGWVTPLDGLTTQIVTQYRVSGTSAWISGGTVDASVNTYFIPCVAGVTYDVRIAGVRTGGAMSVWDEIDGAVASTVLSITTTSGAIVAPSGTLGAAAFSDGTAAITIANFTASLLNLSAACTPNPAILLSLNQGQFYWVYYSDANFTGGSIVPVATQNEDDFKAVAGRYLIGTITTPNYSSGTGGATVWYPTNQTDVGNTTTDNAAAPYSLNPNNYARVQGTSLIKGSIVEVNDGECIWISFPDVTPTGDNLYVTAEAVILGSGGTGSIDVSWDSGTNWYNVQSFTANTAKATYSIAVPAGTDLKNIQVSVSASPSGGSGSHGATINVYDIHVA